VKVYVSLGTREGLADECRAVAKGMERDGVSVKLREVGPKRLCISVRGDEVDVQTAEGWTARRSSRTMARVKRLATMERRRQRLGWYVENGKRCVATYSSGHDDGHKGTARVLDRRLAPRCKLSVLRSHPR